MYPRLVVITGPLEGQTIEIGDTPFSIGRLSSNDLQLLDSTASRRHCVLERKGEHFELADLESHSGTFLNGLPVKERRLEHGDFVKVAGSLFLFLERPSESGGEDPGPVRLADGDRLAESTVRMTASDALERHRDKLLASLGAEARTAKQLEALFETAAAVASARGVDELAGRLLEVVLEVVPAERAAVFLADRGEGEWVAGFAGGGREGEEQPAIHRSVARSVMDAGVAILSNEADGERAPSLLCAPLLTAGKPLGVLYADTRGPGVLFTEDHLRWLAALAALAAPAFEKTRHMEWLEGENRRLRSAELEHDMVGESAPMEKVLRFISRVAPTDATVLIRGESGTGKELAARAIHVNSPRAEKPFVAINCATLSETLLESDLFGHERGAFTGAVARQVGKLETADGGTVFLDEVGEIPVALQAKLLRVLEERAFERVGGRRRIEVDVRLVAATNRDLEAAITGGTFREDLFYRLNVIALGLPALRERRDDIPLLASHFASRSGRRLGRPVAGLSTEARDCLLAYDWPGNVRELKNAVERAVVLGEDELIGPEDLPETVLETGSPGGAPTTYHEAVNETKRRVILDALEASDGSFAAAARRLGLHRNYLHRLVRNLGLKSEIGT